MPFLLTKHISALLILLYPTLVADNLQGMISDPSAFLRSIMLTQKPRPVWDVIKDGNPTAMDLFRRHYSYRKSRDQMKFWPNASDQLFVGPGEKLVLLTPCERALFVWRRERFTLNGQEGVNCAVFRNEGAGLSSDLIREADEIAWEKWPGDRLYTYVDPRKTRHKRDPGRCFLRAGWQRCGITKGGLCILEHLPEVQESGKSSSTSAGVLVQSKKEGIEQR